MTIARKPAALVALEQVQIIEFEIVGNALCELETNK